MDNEDNEEDGWVEVLKRSGLEGKHFEAKGVPQDLLRVTTLAAPAIDVRGIEKVDPELQGSIHHPETLFLTGLPTKFMVPRQMLLTRTPCFPKRLCSIAIFLYCLLFFLGYLQRSAARWSRRVIWPSCAFRPPNRPSNSTTASQKGPRSGVKARRACGPWSRFTKESVVNQQ